MGIELSAELCSLLDRHVDRGRDELVRLTQALVRIPSENTPPIGGEQRCQEYIGERLSSVGLKPRLYHLSDVPGLPEHPLFEPGREYSDRPNLGLRVAGSGGGRSLLLSGHIDTVPRGTQPWTSDPFSGKVEGNRLYGRGSNDMKAGVAMNLFAMESLAELGIKLKGDLVFESVIDEEFGGCNGTLAGRLAGFNADAAILSEPSALRICHAQRGGRTAHITFTASTAGVLEPGKFPSGAIPQLTYFLSKAPDFASQRKTNVKTHEAYARQIDPVPVTVTKVCTAPWGFAEPITVPETAQVELYWQLMPGETQADVEQEFFSWFNGVINSAPQIFTDRPRVEFPIRWMPGSAISPSEPVVQELSMCACSVLGREPEVAGIEGPCDLFILHQAFGIPAVLWGPIGGNTHAANEYVEVDSLVAATKTLLRFVTQWCGIANT